MPMRWPLALMNDPPIFIVGNRRSGTTLLRLMLACHPRIGVPPEGGFVVRLGWAYAHRMCLDQAAVCRIVNELFCEPTIQDWQLDRDQMLRRMLDEAPLTFRRLVELVYVEYLDGQFPGKERWGDKTTWYLDYLPLVHRIFPEAQFIHLIRDGRAVAASFKQVPHLTNRVAEAAMEWVWSVRTIRAFGQAVGPRQYLEVHYEQLVSEPVDELRRICEFTGEDYSDAMLGFWRDNRRRELEPNRHMAWKQLTRQPLRPARIAAWQRELSPLELAHFWAVAGATMGACGYEQWDSDLPLRKAFDLNRAVASDRVRRALQRRLRPLKSRLRSWQAGRRSQGP